MTDLNELEQILRDMKPRQPIYKLVKAEMQRRGRWKRKARGRGFSKGYDERRKGL